MPTEPNQFIEFQTEVEAVKARFHAGEISATERDEILRRMQLIDKQWGDVWMLSPNNEWFRKAKGSKSWVRDYPVALVDPETMPPIPEMTMAEIARAVHDCTKCGLHEGRNRAVPGDGDPNAELMFIGEGPGFNEDKQARPFVGAAGQFLEELLAGINYERSDVYITNVVKCRPPGNRDPQVDELAACQSYLERQIELVDPKVIVTLGRYSMNRYFPGASISGIHGQAKRFGERLVVPMFHPAAALHQPRFRSLIIEDFQKLPQLIAGTDAVEPADQVTDEADDANAEQLSLF